MSNNLPFDRFVLDPVTRNFQWHYYFVIFVLSLYVSRSRQECISETESRKDTDISTTLHLAVKNRYVEI